MKNPCSGLFKSLGPAMLLGLSGLAFAFPVTADVPSDRRAELIYLLRHDCGSCHGMRLTGGLGPPLTPAALSDKPTALLEHTILSGRPGTPMPPWQGILTSEETKWLVEMLQEDLPDAD